MSEGHTERLEAALDRKYRIERKHGEGGMASVYLAEDIKHWFEELRERVGEN